MNTIKLVAIDVDGTLLSTDHEVSEANKKEVNRLADMGIEIVTCTGRPLHEVPEFILEHEKINYIISANGAIVYDLKNKKILKEDYVDKDTMLKVIKLVQPYDCALTISTEGHLYSNKRSLELIKSYDNDGFAKFFEFSRELVDSLEDIIEKHTNKLEKVNFNFENADDRDQILQILSPLKGIHITASFGHNLEVNDIHAQKGLAVDYLRNHLNLDLDQIVTIGDNLNDVSMLMMTKHSFAMGNAPQEVKDIAGHVTDTNDNDGVAKVLAQIKSKKV